MDVFIKIKEGVGLQEEQPQGMWEEVGDHFTMSFQQRLGCFGAFLSMSLLCYGLAIFFMPWIVLAPKKFAFFFTCANLFGIASTGFLMGFQRQLRSMGDHNRQWVSLAYISSMFLTLVAAIQWRSQILTILFSAVQVVSLVWYSMSFVPYARQLASYFLGPLLKVCMQFTQVFCIGCGKCCTMFMK
eukprot:TRINITY_DN30875_c0_g1_i1.p1 TRINITY_DN30875_c0_g1~~TRINITY_DN30875_c0_g1_i1.p1  ORF type:complete len:186 (+),score=78.83 TRINITY_DN30875_c0_g1_i1:106-663(+)